MFPINVIVRSSRADTGAGGADMLDRPMSALAHMPMWNIPLGALLGFNCPVLFFPGRIIYHVSLRNVSALSLAASSLTCYLLSLSVAYICLDVGSSGACLLYAWSSYCFVSSLVFLHNFFSCIPRTYCNMSNTS